MERSKIPMLSRFDAISHIMPFYGQTHRAFLLLSGLWKETREKLDEFYEEFVNHMKEYWILTDVDLWNYETLLPLPNDLFVVNIDCNYGRNSLYLLKFIENLRDSKGWYFNSHYMHSKIKIRDPIKVKDMKILYAYADVLKSTQVILCKWDTQTFKMQCESSTLDTNSNRSLLKFIRTILVCKISTNFIFY